MIKTTVTAGLFTLTVLAPALAGADDTARLHDFATLDRASGQTGAGADLSFVTGDLGDVSGAISRLDLHGQWMHRSGFGAYGTFAVSKAFLDADDPANQMFADAIGDATALSNLELGAQYRRAVRPDLAVIAHAGLVLPTADDEDFAAAATNLISIQRRLGDVTTAMPGFTTLRVGVSPIYTRGAMFVRADLGADVTLDEPEMAESDPIIHANLAVGARQGKLSGAVELVTLGTTGELDEGDARFFHTAALSLRYDLGRFAPSLSVVSPLDDGARGEVITIGGGVAAAF